MACVAHGHGRVRVRLVDAPAFGRPVTVVWRKRRWVCPEPACPVPLVHLSRTNGSRRPEAMLTARAACSWAIEQLRREHASVQRVALASSAAAWRTVWERDQAAADRPPTPTRPGSRG
ncbi:MAG: transposase family protein [Dermatophilaceae bacterium]